MMTEQEVDNARLAAGRLECRQSRRAGAGGQGRPVSEANERENTRRNAEARERRGGFGRLCRGLRSQAMIDDERDDRAARRPRPVGGERGEGEAVTTAGDGQPQPGRCAEGAEWVEKCREFRGCDGLVQQPSR